MCFHGNNLISLPLILCHVLTSRLSAYYILVQHLARTRHIAGTLQVFSAHKAHDWSSDHSAPNFLKTPRFRAFGDNVDKNNLGVEIQYVNVKYVCVLQYVLADNTYLTALQ